MARPLEPRIRERATIIAELLLETTAVRDRTVLAVEVARVVDAADLDAALASLDRALEHVDADDAILPELRALRASVLESARVVSLPAAAVAAAPRALASRPMAALRGPTVHAGFAVSDRAVPLLAALSLGQSARAPRGDLGVAHAMLRPIARELLDDVGALGLLRAPLPNQAWGEAVGFEERLLAGVDALASLTETTTTGPGLDVLRVALEHALDWPVPEPARIFALALLLSLSRSYAALAALTSLARTADERTTAPLVAAVALGAHPDLDRFVRGRILDETRPAQLALWLEVARRRRVVPPDALDLLSHPDERVAVAAARASAFLPPELAAAELVGRLGAESVASVAAASSLSVFGAQAGPQHLRQLVNRAVAAEDPEVRTSEVVATAALTLAVCGDPRDANLFARLSESEPGFGPLLAWHGHPSFVALLLARARASASEVERRVHLSPLARMVVPSDRLAEADEAEILARAGDLASSTATRLRAGEPYRLEHSLADLARPGSLSDARRTVWLEASIAARRPIPVDVDDWVFRQRETLDGLFTKAHVTKESIA